jgi:hypothetical protein
MSANRPPAPATSPEDVPVIRRVGRREQKHFTLLRGEPEQLPLSIRRVLRKPAFGVNWALAHRLPLSLRGSFWLVPGRHTLCLVHAKNIHEVSTACAPTKVALAHGVVSASLRDASAIAPAQRQIVGVVPDGISKAVVHAGNTATRAHVRRHLFVLEDSIDQPPDVVSLN